MPVLARRCCRAFTLVEASVSILIFSLIVYILVAAGHLAQTYFLAGELSYALQGALVLSSQLDEDLRQAVRDPATRKALETGLAGATPTITFYRGLALPNDFALRVVPVRWALRTDPGAPSGYLERTTFDPDTSAWRTDTYRNAPVPIPGTPGTPQGTNPWGLRVTGDASTLVQTVILTVLARAKPLQDTPGAKQDRVTLQIAVGVPPISLAAEPLFEPLKRLDEIPPL